MRPWDGIISEEGRRACRAAGFGRPTGTGTPPALLIIDVQYRTVGTRSKPFWESIKEFFTSCGVAPVAEVLDKLRAIGAAGKRDAA